MLVRIIEPTSKLDSLRVLAEAGMDPPSYRTVKRRLRIYADAGPGQPAGADPAGPRTPPASIKRFATTACRYRTIQIRAGEHTITASDPIPDDLYTALNAIHGTHNWPKSGF